MGLGKVDKIVAAYKNAGKGYVPAAIISRGSLPEGEVYYGTVDSLEDIKARYEPQSPALIIIGEAVGTHPHFYQLVTALNHEHLK